MEALPDPAGSGSAGSDSAGSDSAGSGAAGGDTAAQEGEGKLPARTASERSPMRRMQRMDDPEVLEQVLTGLLSLP
jgi:hypothetical protein